MKCASSNAGFAHQFLLALGQKTGFYLDQRVLRARVEQLSRAGEGCSMLFASSARSRWLLQEAEQAKSSPSTKAAIAVEVGAECARKCAPRSDLYFVREDARKALPMRREQAVSISSFRDPPKLAPSRAARDGALDAYKSLASAACRGATKLGGILVFCSCSSASTIR